MIPLYKQLGKNLCFVRLAGLSGTCAVILGAFGAHRSFAPAKENGRDLKAIFETANRYHFYHTFAVMLVPLCRRPLLVIDYLSILMLDKNTIFLDWNFDGFWNDIVLWDMLLFIFNR